MPLRFVVTAPATVTLEVRRGRTVVARVVRQATAGRSTIVWNGRADARRAGRSRSRVSQRGRSLPPPGRYTLVVSARGGDGQVASDSTRLTLARARR